MIRAGSCLLLILLVASSGCTSYFSNLQTPQKTLNLTESAIFSQEKTQFSATITSVSVNHADSFPCQVTVRMTVKNTGKEQFSLIGYPRLTDAGDRQYTGPNMMFGTLNPGGIGSGSSSITVPSEEEYASLSKSGVLKVKFQSIKPIPYEGVWALNLPSP